MTELVLGREIVAEALRSADVRPYLEAGLTLEFMTDGLYPAYTSVFTQDPDVDAWKFILGYVAEHGTVPDTAVFRLSFPEVTYDLPSTRVAPPELTAMARRAASQYDAEIAAAEVDRHLTALDPEGAGLVMLDAARKILRRDPRGSVRITVDDASFDLEAYLAKEVPRGPGFGLPALDRRFGGFQPGQFITILGRAKSSKTTWLVQSAYHAWFGQEVTSVLGRDESVDPLRTLFVTTEINAEQIQGRFLAYGAQVNHRKLTERTGDFRPTKADKDAVRAFWDGQVSPVDSRSLRVVQPTRHYTVADLELDAEAFEAEIIYVDGFYFLHDPRTGKTGGSWDAQDNLGGDLKSLAMRMKVPVVVTHQVREKQLGKAGGGIDDTAAMGGTALRMFSDLMVTLDKGEDQVVTLKNTATRSGYLPTIRGEWDWDEFRFTVHHESDDGAEED